MGMTHLKDHYKFWIDRIIVKNYKTANDEMEGMRKEASLSCFGVAFQCFLRVGERNNEN
jgi:hypothetical protein